MWRCALLGREVLRWQGRWRRWWSWTRTDRQWLGSVKMSSGVYSKRWRGGGGGGRRRCWRRRVHGTTSFLWLESSVTLEERCLEFHSWCFAWVVIGTVALRVVSMVIFVTAVAAFWCVLILIPLASKYSMEKCFLKGYSSTCAGYHLVTQVIRLHMVLEQHSDCTIVLWYRS